ncbi:MAG: PH domain-containing protein [Streptosporangiaceae bacterium]
MTRADEGLTIRPSPAREALMVLWILFLCLLMVAGAVNEHDPRELFLVLIWLPWLVPVLLLGRFRLSVAQDVLTYRRPLRTRSWRRDQIAEFGIVQSAWQARVGYVYMRTLDGETITFRVAAGSQRRPEKIVGWLAALRDWLSETPSPGH